MKFQLNSALLLASAFLVSAKKNPVELARSDLDNLTDEASAHRVLHYPYAHVVNTSPYPVSVTVEYASLLCSDDKNINIPANGQWTASSRGVCLITAVKSNMQLPTGQINCAAYSSSGTSYSQFSVNYKAPTECFVSRIVSELELAAKADDSDNAQTPPPLADAAALATTAPALATPEQDAHRVLHYPYVHVANTSPYPVVVTVEYASLFCSDDTNINIPANGQWTASSRGVCLVTGIKSNMQLPTGQINCTPYSSSGTSYSQFFVGYKAPTECFVSRDVSDTLALAQISDEDSDEDNAAASALASEYDAGRRALRGSRN